MDQIDSDGIIIRSESIESETAINEIEEIVGDGCFLHMHMIKDNEISILLTDSEKVRKFSFNIKPEYDDSANKIFLNCSGGQVDGESSDITRYQKDILKENEMLRNQIEYLKKNLENADIRLAFEKAENIIKFNRLNDEINILKSMLTRHGIG